MKGTCEENGYPAGSSRLCKYHGRACEFPGRCLNNAPRKYEGDGNVEHIDSERLIVGCVLRMPYKSGAVSAFGDSVVTRIYGVSHKDRRNDTSYDNLFDAAERFAKRAAQRTGRRMYVDMAARMLPTTPWVVWCDESFALQPTSKKRPLQTRYTALVSDFDSKRDNVYAPVPVDPAKGC